MTNTAKRIISAAVMLGILAAGIVIQFVFKVQVLKLFIALIPILMLVELLLAYKKVDKKILTKGNNTLIFGMAAIWFGLMAIAAWALADLDLRYVLMLVVVVVAADTGAWFFGRLIGGDKMWERLSSGKTWAGQIGGIVCGTLALTALIYILGLGGLAGSYLWLGIGVALLSQYGDLTASFLKRKLGLKDFSNLIPGHGGIIDRFDGWIWALPMMWLSFVVM